MRFFKRDKRSDQLSALYRAAEEGAAPPEAVPPETQEEFQAHQRLMRHLAQTAGSDQPANPQAGRPQLLSLVARKQSLHPLEGEASVFNLLKKSPRTVAFAAAAVLFAGAAVGVSAAGGVSDVAGNVADVLAKLDITDRTPDEADGHIDAIQQPEGNGEAADGLETANENANENAEHGLDTAADGADNAGDGIDNASEQGPENADERAFDGADNADVELPDAADNGDVELPDAADNGDVTLPDAATDNLPDLSDLLPLN